MDKLLFVILNHWDVIGLIMSNIAAIFIPSPVKPKKETF